MSEVWQYLAVMGVVFTATLGLALIADRRGSAPAKRRSEGFVTCPLCGDPERVEDIVGGVCLTCADSIAFAQNARRASVVEPAE